MKLNINDMLDELVLKYNINRNNNRFSKMKECINLLMKLFNQTDRDGLILVSNKMIDIKMIKSHIEILSNVDYVILDIDKLEDFNQIKLKECKYAVIVSFDWHREILSELRVNGINALSIYNYFLENGLELNHNYYDIFGYKYHTFEGEKSEDYEDSDNNSNLFYDKKCYILEESSILKKIYLEKLIFDCVYIKDFIYMKKYIQEYINYGYDTDSTYFKFYQEIENLLAKIKNELSEIKNRNILMFWLDALEYGEEKDMPFLAEISKKGIVFENAYTVTPYTHFTMKTLFLKKKVVDDRTYKIKKITIENSDIIKYLKEKGYNFKYYGFSKQFDDEFNDCNFINKYTPASTLYWNMVSNLLGKDSNKLTFHLVHELIETHSPFLSPAINADHYLFKAYADKEEVEYRNKNQAPISRKYIDEQLQFYSELIGENTCNIYMSDHGHTLIGRYHTILNITGNGIHNRIYKQLFSYYNFDDLIRYIVELDENIVKRIFSEYVNIQDIDYYYKNTILKSLNKENFVGLGMIGYRGIITENDMVICYNNGHNEYIQLKNNDLIKEERFNYLIKLAGNNKVNIYEDDFFEYSRYVYNVLENYEKRVRKTLELKNEVLCQMIDEIPDYCKIAIRCGGENTRKLCWAIGYKRQNRINYIIDRNENCISSKLGITFIKPEEVSKNKIDVIIISCMPMVDSIKYEKIELSKSYKVIDMYDYLYKEGFNADIEFYKEPYIESDFIIDEINNKK